MDGEHPRSIRHQLNRVVLAACFLALAIAGAALVLFDQRSYQETWEKDLRTQADLIGLASAPALSFNDPKAALENLHLLQARPNIFAAGILTADGRPFASYGEDGAAVPNAVDGVQVVGEDMIAVKNVFNEGEHLGTVYLRAHHERAARLRQYLMVLVAVIAGSLALALVVSNHLLALITRPLLDVSQVARRITATRDYGLRATRTTNDEVGQVVDAFNDMLTELARRAQALEEVHGETLALNAELEDRVRKRTAELEAANRELEAFSYTASHDLRAPLQTIDSFSNLLERALKDRLDERSRHYLHRVQVNARVMSSLIDSLLRLARVSRAPIERRQVDISALAASVVEGCREQDPGRDAVVEIQPGMLADADATLVTQVMQNLIGNAWKFTSRMPQARIVVGMDSAAGRSPTYFVKDNGAGFDMAYSGKLFDAFQRLHTPAEFPGTGVGLATVHKIVTRHEGRIWAESAPGQGATFFFTLGRS